MLLQFPAVASAPGEKPSLDDMIIFTKGPRDFWPDNIPWLEDAYPMPHFVKKVKEEEEARKKEQGVAAL